MGNAASESLSAKQQRFTVMVGKLIGWATENGYGLTFGEAYRSPQQALRNALAGTGISNSLHVSRLAIDLNLFRDGKFLTDTEDYEPLGVFWESLGGSWGGRFMSPDADHFSLSHNGVR